jgi:hypothetical protein
MAVTVTDCGCGFFSAPPYIFISEPQVSRRSLQATATAILSGYSVASVKITNGGAGYTSVPRVEFAGAYATDCRNVVILKVE